MGITLAVLAAACGLPERSRHLSTTSCGLTLILRFGVVESFQSFHGNTRMADDIAAVIALPGHPGTFPNQRAKSNNSWKRPRKSMIAGQRPTPSDKAVTRHAGGHSHVVLNDFPNGKQLRSIPNVDGVATPEEKPEHVCVFSWIGVPLDGQNWRTSSK